MQIDHIHFYVDDAQQWEKWFTQRLGFQKASDDLSLKLARLMGGVQQQAHTVGVQSGQIAIALSSPLSPQSPIAEYLAQHPPGVADIALRVTDVGAIVQRAIVQGATILQPLRSEQELTWGKISAWGSACHTLIEDNSGARHNRQAGGLFTEIDHVVLNVPAGSLHQAACWYEQVLQMERQQSFTIKTEQSGLYSQVMIHPASGVKFPINEPASENSQIQEFLTANRGAGIQHIALSTPDIIQTVPRLRSAGVDFLAVSRSYYQALHPQYCDRFSELEWEAIERSHILVDSQTEVLKALLLQIFTQPIFAEPTFFFEMIERRHQAQGFGEGNFRALFQAIEREQMKRAQAL
ncbi:MAG: 4-hydroxyphenylpyruvate dioxygenase [Desertifilum sp. SIO1I2]|nr:4-hydroxyphenylpyruvate dioxygenase [Desertifilum sp. SIO1I2]